MSTPGKTEADVSHCERPCAGCYEQGRRDERLAVLLGIRDTLEIEIEKTIKLLANTYRNPEPNAPLKK